MRYRIVRQSYYTESGFRDKATYIVQRKKFFRWKDHKKFDVLSEAVFFFKAKTHRSKK
jgi:hypothetical protein